MKKRIDPGYLISLLLSVVLAFVIGAVILAIAGFSPGKAYLAMLNGAFSSARHIGDLLEYAMVLCLCGLACVLGARVGIFNVGGEGQLLLGAIVACQVGVWLDGLTPWLVLTLAALSLCNPYELLRDQHVWGARMTILSSARPREGLVQALLTLAQLFALLIGAVSTLCAAAQALGRAMQGYAERSKRCIEGARRYAWPRIAGMWMELYRELPL